MRPGTALIVVGLIIVAAGLLVRYAPWTISWFGRLPGDIRLERGTGRVFIPITSMILVSLVVSVVATLLLRR